MQQFSCHTACIRRMIRSACSLAFRLINKFARAYESSVSHQDFLIAKCSKLQFPSYQKCYKSTKNIGFIFYLPFSMWLPECPVCNIKGGDVLPFVYNLTAGKYFFG